MLFFFTEHQVGVLPLMEGVLDDIMTAQSFIENYFCSLTDKQKEKDVLDHTGQEHKVKETSVFHFSGSQKVVRFTKNILQPNNRCLEMLNQLLFYW